MVQCTTPKAGGKARSGVRRGIVVLVAAALTCVAWLVGRMAGVSYIAETPLGTREITLELTAVATVVSGLIAWTVVAVLERYTASARALWITAGLIVLAASIIPVFTTTAEPATKVTLSALHCVAAAVLIPGLLPRSPGEAAP